MPLTLPPPPSPPELSRGERTVWGRMAQGVLGLWGEARALWLSFADSSKNAWWFPLLLGLMVAFDAFVVVLPGDIMVSLAVLSNPARWRKLALVSALGSALGSFALYLVIHHFGIRGLEHLRSEGLVSARLQDARGFFRRHGLFSLALGSILPGGTLPPVVMAGLSTDRWGAVLGWLLLGRTARFLFLGFGTREGWAIYQAVRQEARKGAKEPQEP